MPPELGSVALAVFDHFRNKHLWVKAVRSILVALLFMTAVGGAMAQSKDEPSQNGAQQHSAEPKTEQSPANRTPNPTQQNQRQGDNQGEHKERPKSDHAPRRGFLSAAFHAIERGERVINVFSTLGLAVFTALLFVATLILASYTDDLRRYAEEQASDMKSAIKEAARSADAAVKSAEAAERSSISSRAYIFVSYLAPKGDGPQIVPSPDAKTFSVKIRFSLKNLGQTPALITDLDTHFLIDKERQMINPAPEPGSAKFQDMIESFRQPPTPIGDATESTSDQSYPIFDVGGHAPTPFPAQASMTFDQLFFFRRPVPQLKNVHGSWFFCVVTYRDVFTGRDRHTHYYGKIVGSSFALATQPEYNRWD